jgi:glycosyltransferase involved in cell wall biosynthesis
VGGLRRRVQATRDVWRGAALGPAPAAEALRGRIDAPSDGAVVPEVRLTVHGWAHAHGAPVDRVVLTVDGVPAGRARLGILRPDLSPGDPGAHIVTSGFEGAIDLREIDAGASSFELGGRAYTAEGEDFELPAVRVELARADGESWPAARERAAVLRGRSDRVVQAVRAAAAAERTEPREGLNVLVVTHDLGYGGAPLVLQELLRRFGREGITGMVVGPEDGGTRDVIEEAGFGVLIAGDVSRNDVEAYEGWLAAMQAWAIPQGFDAVIVNTLLCAHSGGELAARLGLPAIWIVHESYDLEGFWAIYGEWVHPYIRDRGNAAFAAAGAVIFEVDATRRLLEPAAPPGSCVTIPYGIDVDGLDRWADDWSRGRARELIGADPRDVVVLCVGTIEPRKAQAQLVEAFARVAPRHDRPRLILVGGRGDGLERAPQIAVAAHGLEGAVGIEPIHPDVRPYYRAADLLVCASDVESLPRSVLEAMALEVPIVATSVFGLPEVVTDGVTGWLCDERDVAALAEALDRALGIPASRREEMGRAARALVRDEHDVDRCAARYAAVVRAVVETGSPGGRTTER